MRRAPGDLSELGEVDGRVDAGDGVAAVSILPSVLRVRIQRWPAACVFSGSPSRSMQTVAPRCARELERVDEGVIASAERVGPVPARARDSGERLALHLLVRVSLVDERLGEAIREDVVGDDVVLLVADLVRVAEEEQSSPVRGHPVQGVPATLSSTTRGSASKVSMTAKRVCPAAGASCRTMLLPSADSPVTEPSAATVEGSHIPSSTSVRRVVRVEASSASTAVSPPEAFTT